MKQTLVLLSFLLTAFQCFSQVTYDDKVRFLVKDEGQAEVSVPFSGNLVKRISEKASVSSVKDGLIFIRLSKLTVEWFLDQDYDYSIVEKRLISPGDNAKSTAEALEWDSYPSYTHYLEILERFSIDYPAICDLDTIGTSINGKLILALKISDNAIQDEDEPEVFYSSTMHGDETAGFILMLRLAEYILTNYSTNERIRNLADNLEIWINPLANPDGTYNNGNIIDNPIRFNANSYDLNRNFPDPLNPYGQGNIQQKETKEMVDFLRHHGFVLSANFHSGAEVVNYPWDAYTRGFQTLRSSAHADDDWFKFISRAYADTVHQYSNPTYMRGFVDGITKGADWYVVYGGRQDFVTWELQGREVTIELDDPGNYPFVTPATELPLLWEYNYRSLIGYLENALYGVHGKVTSAGNGKNVAARIFIMGHDRDSSHVYSDSLSGTFARFLYEGDYDITFSARGYNDTTVSGVGISRYNQEWLPMSMTPLKTEHDPLVFPNPASERINALLPVSMAGAVRIQIFNASGMLVREYNDEFAKDIPIEITISKFATGVYTVVFTGIQNGTRLKTRFVNISNRR